MDLDRLAAAKLWLVSEPTVAAVDGPRDLPYLSHALYALIPVESPDVPTMSIDERWRLYVNPVWLSATPIPDLARQIAHLVWHVLADHAERARDLTVTAETALHWKNGSDATIHATLAVDRLTPADLPSAASLHLPPGRSAEEYYAILSKLPALDGVGAGTLGPADGCGSGADGIPRRHELPADTNDEREAVPAEDAKDIRRRVAIDYTEHAQLRGDRPGEALRWARSILEPKVAWEPILARAVRNAVGWAAGRGEYTYTRLSRHRSAGIVLPGQRRPVPRVALVVDTSASVDDHLLGRALGEVDGVLRALGIAGTSVTVYAVDAALHVVRAVRAARDAVLAGGGGTDLRVGVTAAVNARPRPEVLVVFTDGYTPWPHSAPRGTSVLVALLGRANDTLPPTPAWATRVECRLE